MRFRGGCGQTQMIFLRTVLDPRNPRKTCRTRGGIRRPCPTSFSERLVRAPRCANRPTAPYGWNGLNWAIAMTNQPVLETQFAVDIVKYPLFVPSIEYWTPPFES